MERPTLSVKKSARSDSARFIVPSTLAIYGHHLDIDSAKIDSIRQGSIYSSEALGIRVHKILGDIYRIMTEYFTGYEEILLQAEQFLSFFEEFHTSWNVDVKNVPTAQARAIFGLTPNSRNPTVAARFSRFRFPHLYFEYYSSEPYELIGKALSMDQKVTVRTLWKAWSKNGAASGLVAYGFCDDDFTTSDGHPVISARTFTVVNVFQPELMTPKPYPLEVPQVEDPQDFAIFTTSQTMLQFLRSSRKNIAFLVALSALSASLQPIVDKYSTVGGWVFAGIGVFAALISVISGLWAWLLNLLEVKASKVNQR